MNDIAKQSMNEIKKRIGAIDLTIDRSTGAMKRADQRQRDILLATLGSIEGEFITSAEIRRGAQTIYDMRNYAGGAKVERVSPAKVKYGYYVDAAVIIASGKGLA